MNVLLLLSVSVETAADMSALLSWGLSLSLAFLIVVLVFAAIFCCHFGLFVILCLQVLFVKVSIKFIIVYIFSAAKNLLQGVSCNKNISF